MIVNNAYYELFASYTVPNPNQVGYWIDLGANSKGKIVKVYNENIRQWVKVLDASSEDAVAPFIGSNGNWWVDNRDTGVPASGKNPYVGENGNWFVFDALQNEYVDTGVIAKGKSAYDLAVEHGFEGTEEEWVESLKQPALDAAKVALEAAERADEATATLQQIITEVNEAITQTVAATEAANTAAQAANDAADRSNLIANNPPKIVDNFWYMFDEESGEYVNTNIHAVGDAFTIVKTYESVEAMQADYSNPEVEIGQFVMIDTKDVQNPEDAQLYLKGDTEWKFIADLSGTQGIQGLSAYQVAVQEGFVGSEEEWIASLKGEKGDKGDQGEQGIQGEPFTYDDFTPDQLEGLKGPKGDTGETGPQGEKGDPFVYEDFTSEQLEALRGPQGIQGETGPQGLQGEKGDKGDKGDTGSGLTVKGELQSESELPADGAPGDGYFINGYLYVYVGEGGNVESNPKWSNVGNVQGPQGEPGPQGPKGDTGEQGPKGDQGEQGPIGPEGPQGPAGSDAEVTKENVEAVLTGEITTHTHDDRYYTELEIDEKLSNLPPTYELPIASDSVLGGIKVGAGLQINPETGILSATGGGTADSVDWSNITSKPDFATVATSGSYTDLINKPDVYTKTETDDAIKQASATVFKYKGTVANQEALPTEYVSIGDVYTTSDTSSEYVATKASPEPTWEFLGKVVDLSDYSTTEQNDDKYQPIGDYATNTALTEGLATKVNVEEGKGLSTNDFTTELKSKLEGIEAGAQVNKVTSVAGRQGDIVLTKADVGLDAVDNVSVNSVKATIDAYTINGKAISTNPSLVKEDVGLSNVDNTSDVDKPISTATQEALNLKADATAIADMLTKTEASTTYATKVEANEVSISEGVTPTGEEEIWVDLNAEPNFEAYAITEAPGDGKIYGRNGQTESWEVSVSESQVNDISNRLLTVEKLEYNATQMTSNGYDGLANALASVTDEKYKVRGIVLTWYDTTESKWLSMRYNGTDASGWAIIDNWVEAGGGGSVIITEKLTITLSSNQAQPDAGLNGAKVTITYLDVTKEHTWDGSEIVEEIPLSVEYTITFGAIQGYSTPESKKFTSIAGNVRNVEVEYIVISEDIITINQTISDPNTMIGGDVNGEVIKWIRANSHRVLAKKTAEGKITYCRLKDDDGTKYYDGSTAKTDGSEGDVFVKLPTFYYYGTEGNYAALYFAKERLDDYFIEWDTNILIGAYEVMDSGGKLYSKSGVQSSRSLSQANFKSYASARGEGYQLVDWQMHCVLGCLYYAMYGNTNCQATIGVGTDSYQKINGETNALGMTDTVAGGNGDSGSINFWGLENWWGNKYEFMQEDNIGTNISTYDPVNKGTREISVPDYKSKYPKKMVFGKYLDLIPMQDDPKDGTDSTGYCDFQYWDKSQTGRVVLRSGNSSHADGGVACAIASLDASGTSSYCGSRLAFRGECTEEPNVSTFKSLSVL